MVTKLNEEAVFWVNGLASNARCPLKGSQALRGFLCLPCHHKHKWWIFQQRCWRLLHWLHPRVLRRMVFFILGTRKSLSQRWSRLISVVQIWLRGKRNSKTLSCSCHWEHRVNKEIGVLWACTILLQVHMRTLRSTLLLLIGGLVFSLLKSATNLSKVLEDECGAKASTGILGALPPQGRKHSSDQWGHELRLWVRPGFATSSALYLMLHL